MFTEEEIAEIKSTKMADVIAKALSIEMDTENAFSIQDGKTVFMFNVMLYTVRVA